MRNHLVRFVVTSCLVVGFLAAAGLYTAAFLVARFAASCMALFARAHELLVPVRTAIRTRALLAV